MDQADLRTEVEGRLLAIERLGTSLRLEAVVGTQLSIQQLKVLMLAVHRSPVSGHEVAATLNVTAATVSGLVARLVDAGLLVQEPSPEDGRVRLLRATEAGVRALDEVSSWALEQHREVLAALTPEELAGLAVGLAGVERVLRERSS